MYISSIYTFTRLEFQEVTTFMLERLSQMAKSINKLSTLSRIHFQNLALVERNKNLTIINCTFRLACDFSLVPCSIFSELNLNKTKTIQKPFEKLCFSLKKIIKWNYFQHNKTRLWTTINISSRKKCLQS